MFLRKIFSSKNKLIWVLIDLLIVIIGVYCAFLIQKYSENEKNQKEKEKVLTALKIELETFRYRMMDISLGMRSHHQELKEAQAEGHYKINTVYRFIEPQYDYQSIEYALNLQNNEIVDFELYDVLQSLFVEVKKIEHVEQLLTETARKYKTIPNNLNNTSDLYKLTWTENWDNFNRYIVLINDRKEISGRVAKASDGALPLINERLGNEKAKEIEKDIILKNMHLVDSEEEAVQLGKRFFPKFTEKEIRELYKMANSSKR